MALLRRLNAIADTLKHTQGEVRILRQMMDRIHRRTLAQSRQVAAVNSGTPASPANPALSVGTEAILSTSGSEVSSAHNKPSMIPFPKIEQFRHTCAEIAWHARKRVDEEAGVVDGEPSVPGEPDCPTVDFVGSVKLHGTNASICQRGPGGTMWCQSRQNVLSATRDNAQFFVYFSGQREGYERLMARLWQATQDPRDVSSDSVLSVYGEWCGKGVQKKVAISKVSKRFVVFDVSFSSNGRRHWMDPVVVKEAVLAERGNEFDLYHIQEFPTWNISVDFNNPKLVQNKLIELTEAVEKECPVAAAFGVSGVGEGIVWVGQAFGQRLRFKVKGEEHSVTKVKTLASVDVEKLESVTAFADYACTDNRMTQGFDELFTKPGKEPTLKQTKDLINWVTKDIGDEEADTLLRNKLTLKDVGREIARRVSSWMKLKMIQM